MLSCRSLQPGANEDIVMQAIRQNIRCQQHMAAAVSQTQSRATFIRINSHVSMRKV